MSAYEKHKRYVNNYVLWYGDDASARAAVAAAVPPARNDYDVSIALCSSTPHSLLPVCCHPLGGCNDMCMRQIDMTRHVLR